MLEVLTVLTTVLGAPQQATQAPLVELELSAPPVCPSSSAVLDAVRQRVRHAAAEPLRVRAQIEQRESWILLLQTEHGERRVEGESCEAVAQTLVVLLALAVDPGADVESTTWSSEFAASATDEATPSAPAEASPPPTEEEPKTPTNATIKTRAEPARRTPRAERVSSPLRWPTVGASIGALGEIGALPEPSLGATGALSASWQPWSFKLGAAFLLPQFAQVESSSVRKGGYVSWWSGNVDVCRSFVVVLSACLGVELGRLTGAGRNVQSRTGHALWVAGGPSLGGQLPLGSEFSVFAKLGAYFPVFRPRFLVEPYGELHTPALVSGRLVLGISFR
ncbi:MAG TPA: hypothetical protein VMF89_03675 [Polyangiales bacterium]|nr:hypothetical protein [Polyangiales bacterium]